MTNHDDQFERQTTNRAMEDELSEALAPLQSMMYRHEHDEGGDAPAIILECVLIRMINFLRVMDATSGSPALARIQKRQSTAASSGGGA